MASIPDEATPQLRKLCDLCTYLVDRIPESSQPLPNGLLNVTAKYPHPYTVGMWLESAHAGCAICVCLLDQVRIAGSEHFKNITTEKLLEVTDITASVRIVDESNVPGTRSRRIPHFNLSFSRRGKGKSLDVKAYNRAQGMHASC
jgi:hypothetical protein